MTEVTEKSTDFRQQHDNPERDESEQHGVTRRNVLRAGAVASPPWVSGPARC